MKKRKFSEEQIIAILKEGEAGMRVLDLTRKYGIGESTYFAWKAKYAGMNVSELKKLKQLEKENSQLKRMYANLSMDHELLREVLEKKLGVDVNAEISRKN